MSIGWKIIMIMIHSEISFTVCCGRHEDEDQLMDGMRESEVNTGFFQVLWVDSYNLQAVEIKSSSGVACG